MARGAFHAAIDLGAGSGRVFAGEAAGGTLQIREAHRFQYAPRRVDGRLRWDTARLFDGLRTGLRLASEAAASAGGTLVSAGVDSWGVDYGLLDGAGDLLEEPICYRDERTAGMMAHVFEQVPAAAIFSATGIQFLPFNTIFQLAAHRRDGFPPGVDRVLLIPDLCHHFLCGSTTGEVTNASTTQLLNVRSGGWDDDLFARLDLPRAAMPDLVQPGSDVGLLRPELCAALAVPGLRVVAPATHDTASAVAGTPLEPGWAYISSGTWSLVGVERETPLLGERALRANVTNERGAGGTFRLLKNVMGLWLLESCRRERSHEPGGHAELLAALDTRAIGGLIDPDAPRFLNPPSMVAEIRRALAEAAQPPADDLVALAKVILDSLALRYAAVIAMIESLTGAPIEGVHVTGGGALNDYLNQATANASERPVLAGPVEATAMGNLLVQAVACGSVASLAEARRLVRSPCSLRRFEPADSRLWRDAAVRYRDTYPG